MRLTIVKDDDMVIKDGEPIKVDIQNVGLPEDFHALQWNEDKGHVEYKDPQKYNDDITDLTPFQNIIDLYDQEKQRLADEKALEEQQRIEYELSIEYLRQLRDDKIEDVIWYFERHTMQKELGVPTSLTDEQYLEYLQYLQELRDITNTYTSNVNVVWPTKPSFIN